MTALRISEIARRSGTPATTLRYYERIGLIPAPPRSESGYRMYDDQILTRLAMISRAKALGVRLDDMTDLVQLLDGDRCEPVAERLRHLVSEKRLEVSARVAELTELGHELNAAAAALHSPGVGPCGDECACLASVPPRPWEILPTAIADACSLDRASAEERLQAWLAVASRAASRENIDDGLRLGLANETDLGEVALLAAAESICCPMFEFQITLDGRGRAIEVRIPGGDADVVRQLLGAGV